MEIYPTEGCPDASSNRLLVVELLLLILVVIMHNASLTSNAHCFLEYWSSLQYSSTLVLLGVLRSNTSTRVVEESCRTGVQKYQKRKLQATQKYW